MKEPCKHLAIQWAGEQYGYSVCCDCAIAVRVAKDGTRVPVFPHVAPRAEPMTEVQRMWLDLQLAGFVGIPDPAKAPSSPPEERDPLVPDTTPPLDACSLRADIERLKDRVWNLEAKARGIVLGE